MPMNTGYSKPRLDNARTRQDDLNFWNTRTGNVVGTRKFYCTEHKTFCKEVVLHQQGLKF